jgi:hypothetical protein
MSRFTITCAAILVASVALSSCAPDRTQEFYVVAPAAPSGAAIQDLSQILKRRDFAVKTGRSDYPSPAPMYALDGRSLWLKVWAQNVPMSAQEDVSLCGRHVEAYFDPGQISVTVSRRFPFGPDQSAAEETLAAGLKRAMAARGYQVLDRPVECSEAAKKVG